MPLIDPTQKEIIEEQKAYLKGKSFVYKFKYFVEYYGKETLLILAALTIVVAIIVTVVTKKDTAVNIFLINSMTSPDTEAFASYAGIDTSKEYVSLVGQYILNPSLEDDTSYLNIEKIVAEIAAKDLDGIVGDYESLYNYANSEFFADLRTLYTEEELESLGDKVIWYEFKDDDGNLTGASAPVFIDVTDAPFLHENLCYGDGIQIIYGIIINSPRPETAKSFYSYMYE